MPSLNVSIASFFGFRITEERPGSRLITWYMRCPDCRQAAGRIERRAIDTDWELRYQAAEHQHGEEVETTRADPHPAPSGRERQAAALEQTTTCCPVRSLSSTRARAKALRARLTKRDEARDKPLSAWEMREELLCDRLVCPFEARSPDQRHSILCAAGRSIGKASTRQPYGAALWQRTTI